MAVFLAKQVAAVSLKCEISVGRRNLQALISSLKFSSVFLFGLIKPLFRF